MTPALLAVLAPTFPYIPFFNTTFFFKFMAFGFIFHSGLQNHPLVHAVFGFYSFDILALSDQRTNIGILAIGCYPLRYRAHLS